MMQALEFERGHPAFDGHFPTFPILPGAVLLDAVLSAIARDSGLNLCQWQVACKFQELVRPGDALMLEHIAPNEATIRFAVRRATAAQTVVASGMLSFVAARSGPHGH